MRQLFSLIKFFTKRELKNKNQFIVSCIIPILLMLFMGTVGNSRSETQGYGFPYMTFLLPGIIVMSFLATSIITFPIIIAGFREVGDLKRMLITPVSKIKLILAIMFSSTITMIFQSSIIIFIAYFCYGVHFKLDTFEVIVFTLVLVILSIASLLTLGFMLSGLVVTQRGATTLGSTFNLILPFLSGVYFPLDVWPEPIQIIAQIAPTTYIIKEFRNLIVYPITENTGPIMDTYLSSCIILILFSLVTGLLGIRLFKWK